MIDARGARFAATLTCVVLAATLVTAEPALLLIQGAVFAIAAGLGPDRSPYAWLFRNVIAPRLTSDPEPEPSAPPRFAQAVGLAFALLGSIGALLWQPLFLVATAMAFAAAFLNAAFGYCLGCQMYLLVARTRGRLLSAR